MKGTKCDSRRSTRAWPATGGRIGELISDRIQLVIELGTQLEQYLTSNQGLVPDEDRKRTELAMLKDTAQSFQAKLKSATQ